MHQRLRILRFTFLLCAVTASAALILFAMNFIRADDVPATPATKASDAILPPEFTLRAAGTMTLGEQHFANLTLQATNPNAAALAYTGYAPDSFDPPLQPGHIMPLFQLEVQRDGKWAPYPIGRCGTGLADLQLPPRGSATFDVAIPHDDWQAIKVAVNHYPGAFEWAPPKIETATTTTWSVVFTREEFDKVRAPAAAANKPNDDKAGTNKTNADKPNDDTPDPFQNYQGKEPIPEGLREAFTGFVRSAQGGSVEAWLLPQSVKTSQEPRPQDTREYGDDINADFLKNGFSPAVWRLRNDGDDCYLVRTGTSAIWFVQNKSGAWKVYRYLDKPIK